MNLDAPHAAIELIVVGFELVGVAVITVGSILACSRFMIIHKALEYTARYRSLRQELGGAIVLGLEFLVAGDIIRTVAIEPTLRGVAVLGLIVLIRTFLSVALQIEIEGSWPWQRCRPESLTVHAHRIERSAALKSFVCRLCCRVESSRRLVAAHLGVAGAPR